MEPSALYPEFIVKDLDRSSNFYVGIIGFEIKFSRPEERFQYLTFGSAHIMLLEDNQNQHSRTGPWSIPGGRALIYP